MKCSSVHLMHNSTVAGHASKPATLPLEIWQEIFICSRDFRDPYDRMHFPLAVSAVCTTWWALAQHTLALWSTIVLNHNVTRCSAKGGHEKQRAKFDLVERFLRNSKHQHLSIYIQLNTSNRDKTLNTCCKSSLAAKGEARSSVFDLASLLAPHVARFKRFHVLSTRYSPVRELLSVFPQVVMPCLEELHIDRVQTRLHFDCPRTCLESLAFLNIKRRIDYADFFHDNFPALKSIALSSVPLLLPVFTPRHLTSLKMTLPHLNYTGELRNLLMANAHSLEHLSFMTTHSLGPFQTRDPAAPVPARDLVVFPLVAELTISYFDPDTLVPLMSVLRFPSARSLRVACVQSETHPSENLFLSLYSCLSFAHLKELELENIFSGSSTMDDSLTASLHHPYDILARVTALRTLTIDPVDGRVLSYLNAPRALPGPCNMDGSCSVPLAQLTNLHLSAGKTFPIGALVRFISFRARPTVLDELRFSVPVEWADSLRNAADMRLLARRAVLVSTCAPPGRTAGIWDENIGGKQVVVNLIGDVNTC